jgi:hypothetical protein
MRAPALNTSEHAAALCGGLFDDAALFPPGDAPMAAAVPAHREPSSRLGGLVGPFVVPAARRDEPTAALDDGDRFPVSLIGSAGALPAAVGRVDDLVSLGLLPSLERIPA